MESSEQTGAYSTTTHQFALASVAVVRSEGEGNLGRETALEGGGRREKCSFSFSLARSRAPKFPLPLPLLTFATQASLH